jgi:hypothetical protein
MDPEFLLRHEISNMILEVAEEKEDLTTSDFQGRAEVVARKIIDRVRSAPTP